MLQPKSFWGTFDSFSLPFFCWGGVLGCNMYSKCPCPDRPPFWGLFFEAGSRFWDDLRRPSRVPYVSPLNINTKPNSAAQRTQIQKAITLWGHSNGPKPQKSFGQVSTSGPVLEGAPGNPEKVLTDKSPVSRWDRFASDHSGVSVMILSLAARTW